MDSLGVPPIGGDDTSDEVSTRSGVISYLAGWTPTRTNLLIKLVLEGYSGSAIGHRLGISRDAAIGKAYRLGYRLSGKICANDLGIVMERKRSYEERRREYERARAVRRAKKQLAGYVPMKLVSILELNETHCRFPVDVEGETRYCGRDAEPTTSWCPHHANIVYRSPHD